MYISTMLIEYDPQKNAINRRKHGVDFEDARLVLFDHRALIREDEMTDAEQRFIAVGLDALGRVLTVVYTYREPDTIRLISARKATGKERQAYEA